MLGILLPVAKQPGIENDSKPDPPSHVVACGHVQYSGIRAQQKEGILYRYVNSPAGCCNPDWLGLQHPGWLGCVLSGAQSFSVSKPTWRTATYYPTAPVISLLD